MVHHVDMALSVTGSNLLQEFKKVGMLCVCVWGGGGGDATVCVVCLFVARACTLYMDGHVYARMVYILQKIRIIIMCLLEQALGDSASSGTAGDDDEDVYSLCECMFVCVCVCVCAFNYVKVMVGFIKNLLVY